MGHCCPQLRGIVFVEAPPCLQDLPRIRCKISIHFREYCTYARRMRMTQSYFAIIASLAAVDYSGCTSQSLRGSIMERCVLHHVLCAAAPNEQQRRPFSGSLYRWEALNYYKRSTVNAQICLRSDCKFRHHLPLSLAEHLPTLRAYRHHDENSHHSPSRFPHHPHSLPSRVQSSHS